MSTWASELSDEDLIRDLTKSYEAPIVPPCRVCGAPLAIGAIGGGRPIEYACSQTKLDHEHWRNSRWQDTRQGGDSRVIELIDRYTKAKAGSAP